MTDLDFSALKAAAQKAETPLDGEVSRGDWFSANYIYEELPGVLLGDADFIARASPAAVLALIERLERLEAEKEDAAAVEGVSYCSRCRQSLDNGQHLQPCTEVP